MTKPRSNYPQLQIQAANGVDSKLADPGGPHRPWRLVRQSKLCSRESATPRMAHVLYPRSPSQQRQQKQYAILPVYGVVSKARHIAFFRSRDRLLSGVYVFAECTFTVQISPDFDGSNCYLGTPRDGKRDGFDLLGLEHTPDAGSSLVSAVVKIEFERWLSEHLRVLETGSVRQPQLRSPGPLPAPVET